MVSDEAGQTLEEYLRKNAVGGRFRVLSDIYEKVSRGEIKLVDTDPPRSFEEYLRRLDYSLWFWASLATIIVLALIISIAPTVEVLNPLRYVLGLVFLAFLPGYATLEMLYPNAEESMRPIEELGLSIGTSLAVVPLIVFLLNLAGLSITPITVTYSVGAYTTASLVISAYRKASALARRVAV